MRLYSRYAILTILWLGLAAARAQTVINYGDTWKYNAPTIDPGTAWRGVGFDDSSWGAGAGLLGYDADFPACCPSVPAIQTAVGATNNGLVTYLFRKTFTFSGDPVGATLVIDHIVDDGVSYYLNGNLIGSVRHTPGAWDKIADTPYVGNAAEELTVLNCPATGLINGTNVLSAEVHNNGAGASDMVFGARLKVFAAPATSPIRIMPLGDSITFGSSIEGSPVPGGYRAPLYNSLTAAGYNVDFVGTDSRNGVGSMPDSDHEGHPGWRINMLDERLATWLNTVEPPDVILLHIGTNDFGFNQDNLDTTKAINRLDVLISHITAQRPNAHLIVTNVLARSDSSDAQIQAQYNPFIAGLVTNHAAQGQLVTYLDMRSQLTLADLAEGLHPNQGGYNKMAAAWLPAITALVAPEGDNRAPVIAGVTTPDSTHVVVSFSKALENAAATIGNFTLSNGLTVSAAVLSSDRRKVTLTTSSMTNTQSYVVSVSNVRDRTTPQHTIAAASTAAFTGPAISGALINVPEAANYTLVYSLNIPNTADYNLTPPTYAVDNHVGIGAFSRVGYYLELQKAGEAMQYCWVSMDAFTTSSSKIGVPCTSTSAIFQQSVYNVRYASNVPSVGNSNLGNLSGRLEFWPTDYGPSDTSSYFLFASSSTLYDSGDERFASGNWGSMQVHIEGATKTLFAYNHWGNSGSANCDLGIGNNPVAPHKDWTYAVNANTYTVKTLQVYVRKTQEFSLSGRLERVVGVGNVVTFIGLPNGNYRIQRSTNLPTWSNLADLPSNGAGDISYTDTSPPAGKAYYQVQRLP